MISPIKDWPSPPVTEDSWMIPMVGKRGWKSFNKSRPYTIRDIGLGDRVLLQQKSGRHIYYAIIYKGWVIKDVM